MAVTTFKRTYASTVVFSAPDLQQATVDSHLHQRLLDTHRQVWVNLLWGPCQSLVNLFLLGPGAQKVLFVPSKSLFSPSLEVL